MSWGEERSNGLIALEREHYPVARAAVDLANKVRAYLYLQCPANHGELVKALEVFDSAASHTR